MTSWTPSTTCRSTKSSRVSTPFRTGALGRARGREVELVLYPEGRVRTEYNRRVLTRTVLAHLEPGVGAQALARANGAQVGPPLEGLPDHYLFSVSGAAQSTCRVCIQLPDISI